MAVIYLRHPKHGVKVATMDLEAAYDEENGWERFAPTEMTNTPSNAIVRRRGQRPRDYYEEAAGTDPDADFP
jgi:hypothetical protein